MNENGHGLIELLLALPLMLLIIFGALDVSHSIDNAQAATMLAREGANRGRRVCMRTVPNLTLDQTCMNRLMVDVPAALESAQLLVSIYVIAEDSDGNDFVELIDFSASWDPEDGSAIDATKWDAARLEDESEMVAFALELRQDEQQKDLVRENSFIIAVSEVFYENQAFSSFSFIPAEGYEVSIF